MSSDIWGAFENVKQSFDHESESESSSDDENSFEISDGEGNTLRVCKKEELLCYQCGSDNLTNDEGSVVCCDCGIDNGQIIDYQQEWRFYGSEDTKKASDPTRCGMPVNPLLPDSSMGTIILGSRGFDQMRKLNSWNSMTYKERSLLKVFRNIQEKSDENDISLCVVDRAKVMYKTLSENSIKRGKSRKGLIAACLYNSCKDKDDSRSTKEISQMFGLKIKKMTNGCKQFNEMMYHNDSNYLKKIKPTSAQTFIERYSVHFGINKENKEKAIFVSNMATKLGLVSENTPSSIAVGSIYLVSQEYNLEITKKQLSEACNISEVTISKTYKKMVKFTKFLLPMDD